MVLQAYTSSPADTCPSLLVLLRRQDQKEGRDASELLSADLARLAPLTNALFFGLVGASLKLRGEAGWAAAGRRCMADAAASAAVAATVQPPSLLPLPPVPRPRVPSGCASVVAKPLTSPPPCPAAVRDSLWAAAILYVVRLAGIWLGCWLGAGAGGTPPDVGQRLWMGMITQVCWMVVWLCGCWHGLGCWLR